jgi:predicted PurR-regulated permease PerM
MRNEADKKKDETHNDTARVVLAVLFILALIGSSLWILRPFLVAIVWAGTIVVATWPLMIWLQARLWNKRALAVAVMTLLLLCVLLLPLTFAIGTVVANVDTIIAWAKSLATFKAPPPPGWLADLPFVGGRAIELWNRVAGEGLEDIATAAAPYAAGFIGWSVGQVGNIGIVFVEILLTIVLAATLYAKGELATRRLLRFGQRLAGAGGEIAVWLAGQTIRGVALGVVVTALAQTVLGGIGLMVAGVPFATLLTVVMFLLSIAQIGVVLVLASATAWLYWTGAAGAGTFMLVWTIVVGGMDNFLRPILIRRGADLPLLLVFAGVIGGLLAMGLIGIFVGPVILAVADKLLNAWIDGEIQHESDEPQRSAANAFMKDRVTLP